MQETEISNMVVDATPDRPQEIRDLLLTNHTTRDVPEMHEAEGSTRKVSPANLSGSGPITTFEILRRSTVEEKSPSLPLGEATQLILATP
jgi:hypothetical protein